MLTLRSRLWALVVALAIAASQSAVCAGWMPTPAARMACCSDAGGCPMHASHGQSGGAQQVAQAEADRCCARSEQGDTAPLPSNPAFVVSLEAVIGPVFFVIPEPDAGAALSRAPGPLPAPRISRHLLLSVLLV